MVILYILMQTYDILEDDKCSHFFVELDSRDIESNRIKRSAVTQPDDQSSVNLSEVYSNN